LIPATRVIFTSVMVENVVSPSAGVAEKAQVVLRARLPPHATPWQEFNDRCCPQPAIPQRAQVPKKGKGRRPGLPVAEWREGKSSRVEEPPG